MGRKLGQHFLFDPGIQERIAAALEPARDDAVLEIGPGPGSLTQELIRRVGKVVAVERDDSFVGALHQMLPEDRASVISGDALELDWDETMDRWAELNGGPYKVVGNIPYQITTPLIDRALTSPRITLTVFLVQLEVAERLTATPGSKAYGALTVGVRAVARVERLFRVKAGSFRPPPKVDSAAVRIRPLERPLLPEEHRLDFRRFVTALFGMRRKQVGGSLASISGRPKEVVRDLLVELGRDPKSRPEVMTPEELVDAYLRLSR